ncbi:MAG: lysine--tRNA ligase [Candidatus Nanoarchaeia archaeon]
MDLSNSQHWAVQAAKNVVRKHGDKEIFVCAAGITPSGVIHLGNFREVITVEIVVRALQALGHKTRFIYSWDDFDAFRKVPVNVPQPELLKEYLRKPTVDMPDTYGCGHTSYAEHHIKHFEAPMAFLGIAPEYVRQHVKYRNCDYAKEMDYCLQRTKEIKEIIDSRRKEPHPDDWTPIVIFCDSCKKDTTTKIEYKQDHKVFYSCECGHSETFDLREKGIAKLKWRVDWPMRWKHESVAFEPAGKDHFAAGGSRETGVSIFEKLWEEEPPFGFMYEWIAVKGGGEFSSSKGEVITVQEALEVYEPEVLRWLFSGSRPRDNFNISFDEDVLSFYETFDKCERIALGKQEAKEKEVAKQKAIYYFSCVDELPSHCPIQPGFGYIVQMLQTFDYDESKTYSFLSEGAPLDQIDHRRLTNRIACAKNWLEKHAPESVKFKVNVERNSSYYESLPSERKEALTELKTMLEGFSGDLDLLTTKVFEIPKSKGLNMKEFFTDCYQMILSKEKGPKLAPFILEVGKERVAKLL